MYVEWHVAKSVILHDLLRIFSQKLVLLQRSMEAFNRGKMLNEPTLP